MLVTIWDLTHQPEIISPLPDPVYAWFEPTPTPTKKPEPTYQNAINLIVSTFSKHGKTAVKQALDIAFCESGWRHDAYNYNSNFTSDFNIFQINTIHQKRFGTAYFHDWEVNIRTAEVIYSEQGWTPWVCAKKLGIVN